MRANWPILLVLGSLSGAATTRAPEVLYAGDLVEELSAAASDAEVEAFRAWAVGPGSPFAASLREGDRDHAARLDRPSLYAVRAAFLERGVVVETAIVWTNRGSEPVAHLPLRLYPLFGGGTATIAAKVDGRPAVLDHQAHAVVRVRLPAPVPPGGSVRLRVNAVMEVPPPCRDGAARDQAVLDLGPDCGGGRFHATTRTTVLGHWLPTVLPQVDGRFAYSFVPVDGDPPTAEPALYHVVLLDVPEGARVGATGVQVSEDPPTWVAAASRDFAAVVSRDLLPAEVATVEGTTVRVWTDPLNPSGPVRAAAAEALAFYTEAFGPLPWADVDLVEAPVVEADGIEFAQLATFERRLDDDGWRRWVVAHELAHQWWQLEVGNDGVAEPWVDESLTEWSTIAALSSVTPDEADATRERWLASYAQIDEDERSVSVRLPADSHYAVFHNAYVRGWLFYDELDRALGRDRLLVALRAWREHAHCRWGTGDELLATLREADPAVVDGAIERFLDSDRGLLESAAGAEDRPRVVRGRVGVGQPAGGAGAEGDR